MVDEIFDGYSKEKEPAKYYKSYAWKTAIGLQDVDGLEPSEYLIKTANQNIRITRKMRREQSVRKKRTELLFVLRKLFRRSRLPSPLLNLRLSINAFLKASTRTQVKSAITISPKTNGYLMETPLHMGTQSISVRLWNMILA